MDDYLSYFQNFPNMTLNALLFYFLLGLMRIGPIVSMAPFLGAKLPAPVKMGLAISLTIILLPMLVSTMTSPIGLDSYDMIVYGLKEFFIGIILGTIVGIPFYIAQSSGVLIDFLRGSSSLMVQDPIMQSQVSSIGMLYNYVFIVLFFQIGGPFIFFNAVLHSYSLMPVDTFFNPTFFNLAQPLWQMILGLLTRFLTLSIQLAAPSIVGILMAEMFLGIANRLAPQVQIAFLGMSIKSLLGIALLCAAWFFILDQLSTQALLWLTDLDNILPALRQ